MGTCLSVAIAGGLPEQTTIFFPDAAMPCHAALQGRPCHRRNCAYAHRPDQSSLMTLLAEINRAKRNIDVCVFTITCNELAEALIDANRRGVRVRIITDGEQAASKGSDVAQLKGTPGIEVRTDRDENSHMHHKFAIIDYTTLLNGSFNWTRGAVLSNHENVRVPAAGMRMLTSSPAHLSWRSLCHCTTSARRRHPLSPARRPLTPAAATPSGDHLAPRAFGHCRLQSAIRALVALVRCKLIACVTYSRSRS